jgi:hypothetical protein
MASSIAADEARRLMLAEFLMLLPLITCPP